MCCSFGVYFSVCFCHLHRQAQAAAASQFSPEEAAKFVQSAAGAAGAAGSAATPASAGSKGAEAADAEEGEVDESGLDADEINTIMSQVITTTLYTCLERCLAVGVS
jgi:NACalpha-BTF3-like transcription factor